MAAQYSVPVAEEYAQYASFELKSFKNKEYDEVVRIKYKIPKVLTGVEQEVVFIGEVDQFAHAITLNGPNGEMNCQKSESKSIECRVVYKNLLKKEEQAILEIIKVSKSSKEVLGRIEVMRSFSSDPVGIIRY